MTKERWSPKRYPLKRPLFVCGLTAVAVTAAAVCLRLWVAVGGVATAIALLLWRRRIICAAAALLFLLTAVGYVHYHIRPTAHLAGQEDTITGVVVAKNDYDTMFTLRITDSHLLRPHTRVMLCNVSDGAPAIHDVVTAKVEMFASKEQYDNAQGVFVRAFADDDPNESVTITDQVTKPLYDTVENLRLALMAAPRRILDDQDSAVLTALCFGETAFLSDATTAAYQGSGLSHILVISGLHLSLVAVTIRRLLRRLGMRLSAVFTLLAVWGFALFVGASPSVLRAAMMATVWLAGSILFCRSDGLNSLGLAATILLAVNPYTIRNVGFQLSFAATAGVLLLVPRLAPRPEAEKPDLSPWQMLWAKFQHLVVSGGIACMAALLFTLPIAAYHYGGFPLTSLPANVLAVPAAGAALTLGWLGAIVGCIPYVGWLSHGILLIAGYVAQYITKIAELFSPDWAWVSLSAIWQWLLLAALCTVTVCGILRRMKWTGVLAGVCVPILIAVCALWPLSLSQPRITVIPMDNECGFVVEQGARRALLLTHSRELNELYYNTNHRTADLLLVGEGDAADLSKLNRFSARVTLTLDGDWIAENSGATVCPENSTVHLWEGCRLTVRDDGWWLLHLGDETVGICTDVTVPCPDPSIPCLYVGGVPNTPPENPYVAACSRAWLRRHRPALTGQEIVVTDESIILTPKGGEWRTQPWL